MEFWAEGEGLQSYPTTVQRPPWQAQLLRLEGDDVYGAAEQVLRWAGKDYLKTVNSISLIKAFFVLVIEAFTVESMSMTFMPGRSIFNMSRLRMKKSVKISIHITKNQHRLSRRGRSRALEQNLLSLPEISITWRRPRRFQAFIILLIRNSSLKRLMWTSKPTSKAHSNQITNGNHQARRKLDSSVHWPKNSNKLINN